MSQKSARGGTGGGKAPPKGKKAQGGGKKVEDDREETLQAVVCTLTPLMTWSNTNASQILADSFETRFNPFTLEVPRVRSHKSFYSPEHCSRREIL
jgi:translation initiation factor eIF-2B subunit epsilon